ncbi:YeeE/YedE family protein [Caldisphaera sp.]|jgi:uncharacterized membrane protein YedE/YeeE|uniref:YeeE/YedE family protein n=1 Tax=Caldisphaera sp. TaxID=2060322 RepID=UPI003D0C300A
MGPLPLFNYPAWVIGLFYGLLGIIAGIMGAKYTYCIVVATHQVMGLKYSKIYEIILTGIAVSALGVGILTAFHVVPYVDAYYFMPGAGWYTLLGSFIFGFGIMLGNGCMFGMLWKSGVGYVVNWFEIIGMIIGTVIFAYPIFDGLKLGKWWNTNEFFSIANGNPVNFIPYNFGSFSGFALLIGIIFAFVILLPALWMRKNRKEFEERNKGALYQSPYFIGTIFGLIMIGSFIFAAGHFFNYLGVTTPIGLFSEYLLRPFGINLASKGDPNWFSTVPVISAFTFFILMVILGAFIYASSTGTFDIKLPSRTTNRVAEIVIAFIGGIILAIGARIAQGCSVGGFWSGLTGLSIFGLIFTVGFIPGTIAGYYAYVNLSSWAASLKRNSNNITTNNKGSYSKTLVNLIFGIIFGLLLIGIAFELPSLNSDAASIIKSSVLVQYQNVLLGWGIFSILVSFLILSIRKFVLRR